jgi:tRNA nucleotidyltransferase (CCA-adding enzyme)
MELILPHINADFDAVASALAATKLYPNARVFFPGSQEHNVRDFLGLHPGLLPVIRSRALKKETVTHMVLVDVSSAERLGEFKDLLKEPQVHIIRYDHHGAAGAKIPAEQDIIRNYGANTTLMVQELRQRKIPVTPMEATVYALGIYEETGHLTFTSTTPEDLEAAAFLLKCGADLIQVADFITRRLNTRQQEILNDLLRTRETLAIQGVEISFAWAERDDFTENLAQITSRLRELENLPVLFALCRMGFRTYLVARSRVPEVDAGAVLRRLGGGGHPTAAAATLKALDLNRLKKELIGILHEEIKPVKTAGDLMIPVATVSSLATIADAREIMSQSGCSGLVVMDNNKLAGIITRHDLEKALHHGLAQSAVRHYMSTRLVTAQRSEPATQVQRDMIIHTISHVPVLDEGRLVGMVTRSALMQALLEKKTALTATPGEDFFELQPGQTRIVEWMREQLPEKVMGLLHAAGEVADQMGFRAYVVGGFVRDILLRKENWDIDIVVEGNGIDFADKLASALGGEVKAAHHRFGTALVILPQHLKLDVVTARTEFYAQPAALPQVEASSLKADLFRRDFTINAMAIQINAEDFGQLKDYFGGQQDLKAGLIRVLYAVSFIDDPTRIFRAVRFEQRYNFRIEQDTEHYIQNALKLNLMGKLSFPRIFAEVMLILAEDQPAKALGRLSEFGVLSWIHPRLVEANIATRYFEAVWQTFAFALLFLDSPIQRQWVYLMALLDSLTPQETMGMVMQYQFPRGITEALIQQKKQGEAAREQMIANPGMPVSKIYALLQKLSLEVVLFEMAKAENTPAAKSIHDYLARWRQVRPLLTGKDLKRLHYPPGPQYQDMLNQLLAGRLDGSLASRQDELTYLQDHFPLNPSTSSGTV